MIQALPFLYSVQKQEEERIKIEKGKQIYLTDIGGRMLGYLHKVLISLNGKNFPCRVVFSEEFTVSFNLPGRNNFFEPFAITFLEKNKKVVIKTNTKRQK